LKDSGFAEHQCFKLEVKEMWVDGDWR